ncbi:hypothetical protein Ptr902_11669 [Pyrenophora tritici-repentis]|nr:hypothetical protein Ptr902_11669 [Pyrenophora tritici-repentis]
MLPYVIQYDWAEYKKDTKYIAGYLLQESKNVVIDVVSRPEIWKVIQYTTASSLLWHNV